MTRGELKRLKRYNRKLGAKKFKHWPSGATVEVLVGGSSITGKIVREFNGDTILIGFDTPFRCLSCDDLHKYIEVGNTMLRIVS